MHTSQNWQSLLKLTSLVYSNFGINIRVFDIILNFFFLKFSDKKPINTHTFCTYEYL